MTEKEKSIIERNKNLNTLLMIIHQKCYNKKSPPTNDQKVFKKQMSKNKSNHERMLFFYSLYKT